jgi:predicted SpoU family rRNA methylase
MNEYKIKNNFDFETHVKLTLREKRPRTGAYLIQTRSNDLSKIVDTIKKILVKEGVDTNNRPVNGHVRILIQLQSKGKWVEIHTYNIEIDSLHKIIVNELSLIDNEMIHGHYSDKVMNKRY